MATRIRNLSNGPLGLPFPLRGVLGVGQSVVIDVDKTVVIAAIGGNRPREIEFRSVQQFGGFDEFFQGDLFSVIVATLTKTFLRTTANANTGAIDREMFGGQNEAQIETGGPGYIGTLGIITQPTNGSWSAGSLVFKLRRSGVVVHQETHSSPGDSSAVKSGIVFEKDQHRFTAAEPIDVVYDVSGDFLVQGDNVQSSADIGLVYTTEGTGLAASGQNA